MSGILAAAFALLLVEPETPHPSTQVEYQPPAIRPFEPPSNFGRDVAEESEEERGHRGPLRPVKVDEYRRSYELSPADPDVAYDQGVTSAEIRADQSAGPLGGYWRAADPTGAQLFELVLTDDGGRLEGGWRNATGSGGAAVVDGQLELEGLGQARLTRQGSGWGGLLELKGRTLQMSLTRLG
jgi:hypothetical protein